MNRWVWMAAAVSLVCARMHAGDPAGAGLDLIVMIDRSRSMAGERVELLPALAAELVAHNAEANRVTHRLGVVSFGPDARIDLPLTPIRGTGVRRFMRRAPHEARGHTDVLAAFETAARLFGALPPDPARRRAVVVVTDGVPYVPERDAGEYGRKLREFVAANLARATIDVLLVRRGDAREDGLWRALSSSRVHDAAGRHEDKLAALHRVVAALVGTRAAASRSAARAEIVILPPYLDFVVFDIFRGVRAGEIEVLPPGASRPLNEAMDGVELVRMGDVMTTVVVNRPAPGTWTFRASRPEARVRVFAQEFFPRGTLVVPSTAAALRQHDRVAVAYRVVDSNGQPLTEIAGYPLSLDLELMTPSGARIVSRMARRPDLGPAIFAAATESECGVPGRYWTEVRIATRDAAQRQVDVFRDRWSGFFVAGAMLVDCRHTPRPIQPIVWSRSVRLRVECRDPSGRAQDIVPPEPDAFRASLRRNGRPVASTLRVAFAGRGAFAGSLRGAGYPGSYTMTLAVDRSRLRGPYNVRILPPEVSFTRALGWLDIGVIASCAAAVGGFLHVVRRAHRTA